MFKIGDVVRLKCGGPKMVVDNVSYQGYHVLWHGREGDLKQAVFEAGVLEEVTSC